ncbi:MAG: DUF4386 domain-containing protein [Bacteroidetes bacterium]|nr:DUF4386 domain-containing protein [Bacteroidota bacterium]
MSSQFPSLKSAGWSFLTGSVLVLIPYSLLVARFKYPEVLRKPAGEILASFHAGGPDLILLWLAFALCGIPLLYGYYRIGTVLKSEFPFAGFATVAGLAGGFAQIIGLLRWVFVVPVLAETWNSGSEPVRIAAETGFLLQHQAGGVLLGEFIGQTATIFWLISFSVILFQARVIPVWVMVWGLLSGVIYFLAQAELLSTVIPEFPVWGPAGLIGSTLWLLWMVLLGFRLIRKQQPG